MVDFTRSDLDFILTQIQMAESGQEPVNPHLSFGLRQVDGQNNSVVDGQALFGAADQIFPRISNPVFQNADPSLFGPSGQTSYASTSGSVFDAAPRIISNLIADQSTNNPAAIAAQQHASEFLGDGYTHALPGVDGILGTADDVIVNPATPAASENGSLFINNVTPDNGLSAPFNSLFTLFGQFFDHGLDLTAKGGSGTVFIPLQPDDPLYVAGGHSNFMVLTRATNLPGPDGILGTPDDVHANTNLVTPFVDQNQTYTSHPSHQAFLREYTVGVDGAIHATGRLLEGTRPDGSHGEPTWADIKANALKIGIVLNDTTDVVNVPLIKVDAYGNFIPDPGTGLAQLVTDMGADGRYGTADDVVLHGTWNADGTINAITTDGALRIGTAFINDMAANANPVDPSNGHFLTPASDGIINDATHPLAAGTFDVDLLNAHFVAGDGRANENIGLTSIHEIFHDEHNRLIDETKNVVRAELAKGDTAFASAWVLPGTDLADGIQDNEWNGERLFQAAKFGTETQYQHLVFEEFARKVSPAIHLFGNVNVHLDPAITQEFANAVYRFGHSMLDENINRYQMQAAYLDADGHPTATNTGIVNPLAGTPVLDANGHPVLDRIGLIDAFTNPLEYASHGANAAGEIALGATNQVGNEIDEFVTGALRNNLLGLPLDLAALNIARGRDVGIAPLNVLRNQLYTETQDTSFKPYSSWTDFGHYLKHEASLINFVAAYGTHASITSATTAAEKRDAAMALVSHGRDGFVSSTFEFIDAVTGQPTHAATHTSDGTSVANVAKIDFNVSAADIKDAHDFMNGLGAYAHVTDPVALKADPKALHGADGSVPFWSTGDVTGLDHVDLWIGGLAEKQNLFGGLLGSTFDFIFRSQMENLQDGDRLYYLPRLEGTHFAQEIEGNSFAEMIMHNTGAQHITASAFLTPEYTVEAAAINPDDPTTWTHNPISGKTLLEASWATDGHGNLLVDSVDPTQHVKDIHFLGDDNFLGNTMALGGTAHDDYLMAGNADDDTVYGDGGNDHIDGGNGNDFLYGGDGNDVITDTAGDDVIHGDAGDDTINAGIGDDIVFGNDGNDTIDGGKGIDDILGGLGNDVIRGGEGDDEIQGNEGADWIEGGQGGDVLVGDTGAPTGQLPLFGGDDVIIGGTYVATGPDGHPLPDAANAVSNNGGDKLEGFSGDDIMVGGGGFNTFKGLKGYDWASFEFDTQGVSVDMTRKDFILGGPALSPDAIRDVFIETEGVSGSSYNDELIGTNDARADTTNELTNIGLINGLDTFFSPAAPVHYNDGNIMLGAGGSDRIQGGGGNDIIDGDAYLHVSLQNGQITREILNGGHKGDVNTAVYSDIAAHYAVGVQTADGRGWNGLDAEGFISVVHVTVGANNAAVATKVVDDGVDKIRNIERLEFQDGVHSVGEFVPTIPVKNQLPFGTVTIAGNAVVGQVLTANAALVDLDAAPANQVVTNETFQWQYLDPARGIWVPITGATGATHQVAAFEVGNPLRVVVSFLDAKGYTEVVPSAQTGAIVTAAGVNTAPFVVPQIGQIGLPDTVVYDNAPVNLFLPVTTVFGDAQTPSAALKYNVTLANGAALSTVGLNADVSGVATNGAVLISGLLKAGVTGPLDIKVSATDNGPGTPLTVTDTFKMTVAHNANLAMVNGVLQDGNIAGATVFMDSNNDGVRESFEAQATTDAVGHFTLNGRPGPLIAAGGAGATDIATNLPFNDVYKAPINSTVITPLTTALVALMDLGDGTLPSAQAALRGALGLAPSVDVTQIDPVQLMHSGDPAAKALAVHLFTIAAEIGNTVAILHAAAPNADPLGDITAHLATGQPFDLNAMSTIADLVAGAGLTGAFADDTTKLIADSNALLGSKADLGLSADQILVGVTAVSLVARGATASLLSNAFELVDFDHVTAQFTGAALTAAVNLAMYHVGDVNGDGTSISKSLDVAPTIGSAPIDVAVNENTTVAVDPALDGATPAGTVIGTISASDLLSADQQAFGFVQADLAWSIANTDGLTNSLFALSASPTTINGPGATGMATLSLVGAPDFEALKAAGATVNAAGQLVFDVGIQVSDGLLTATQTETILINNVDEATTGNVHFAGATVTGNSVTFAATDSLSDPDVGGAPVVTYGLQGLGAPASGLTVAAGSAVEQLHVAASYGQPVPLPSVTVLSDESAFIGTVGADVISDTGVTADVLVGFDGNDTYVVRNAGDSVLEGLTGGTDTVSTSLGSYTLGANLENLKFADANGTPLAGSFSGIGNTLANVIAGGTGANTISAGDGNDIVVAVNAGASTAASRYDGGAGTDLVDYSANTTGLSVNMATGSLAFTGGSVRDTITNIENVTTGSGNDTFASALDQIANAFDGGGGVNTISFAAGAAQDLVVTMATGAVAVTGFATDTIHNIQNVIGGAGNDTFVAAADNVANTFDGGAGTNKLDYSAVQTGLTATMATGAITFADGSAGDTIKNVGNVTLGAGNDTLVTAPDAIANSFVGGAGLDTANYATATRSLAFQFNGAVASVVTGSGATLATSDTLANFENFTGGNLGNIVTVAAADTANHVFKGGSGVDQFTGGTGNDTVLATLDAVRDVYNGAGGNNTADYSALTAALSVDFSLATATVVGSGGSTATSDTLTSFQNFTGGNGNDTIVAATDTTQAHRYDGGGGTANTIDFSRYGAATSLAVTLSSTGIATAVGGTTDTIRAFQNVVGGAGADTIKVSSDGLAHALDGGVGRDTLDLSAFTTNLAINMATIGSSAGGLVQGTTDTVRNFENVVAGSGNDTVVVSRDGLAHTIDGSAGNDTIDFSSVAGPMTINLVTGVAAGPLVTDTIRNFENVIGTGDNDTIVFAVRDTLNHAFDGRGGTNTMDFSASTAGVQADFSTATAPSAAITLTNFANVNGGTGADVVKVGTSTLTFTGNAGSDTLVFANLAQLKNGNARDAFTDFTAGADKIDMSRVDANTTAANQQHFSFNDATALWNGAGNEFATGSAGQARYHYATVGGATHTILDLHTTNAAGAADHQIDLGAGQKVVHAADLIL